MAALENVLTEVNRAASVEAANEIVRTAYGLSHVTYHLVQTVSSGVDSPFVRTTYPMEWVGVYVINRYVDKDPVVKAGISRLTPFDWSSLQGEPHYDEIMSAAAKYSIARNGFSIPIIDKNARRALWSLNSMLPDDQWQGQLKSFAPDWIELAHSIHRKAIKEAHGESDPIPKLSRREIECLRWAGKGKDSKDIAAILNISEHTVRTYFKSARFKLDCSTVSQAVTKAMHYHIIAP